MELEASTREQVNAAASVLASGGLVAFPTETVYGLGADAMNEGAVRRVFALKGRPSRNPLIVHVSSIAMAQRCVAPGAWDARAQRLADAFWPGPLTMVLLKAGSVLDVVTGSGQSVALRMPAHPIALALIDALGSPLVGPSANVSGHVSPTTAAHVLADFGSRVMVLDGGACRAGIESTVVSLRAGEPARVLRQGVVTPGQIAAALGELMPPQSETHEYPIAASDAAPSEPLQSPGLLDRHYAPRSATERVRWGDWASVRAIIEREQGRVGVLCFTTPPSDIERAALVESLGEHPEPAAARLYGALRTLDAESPSVIAIEVPSLDTGRSDDERALWAAIRDRLWRATER